MIRTCIPGTMRLTLPGTLHRGLGVSAGALSAPRASDCVTPRIDGSPGLDLHSIQSRCGSGLGAGYDRKTRVNGPAPQIRSGMRRVRATSHFDTAEPPEALAGAARYRSSTEGRWLDAYMPL